MNRPNYKAVLVDDEPIILRSLEAAIPWRELGIDIAGQARNGEEALKLFREAKPDIVVSDIRMPSIDGIALMGEVMKSRPNLIFIVISGYGEFDYAREAIRQGAFDYLLKPIDHDELTEMIRKAVRRLDKDRQAKEETEKLMHSVQALSLLARERMFAELIEGNQRPLQHLRWLESGMLEQPYYMAVVRLDHYSAMNKQWTPEEKRLWLFAVRNILEEWSATHDGLAAFPFHSGEWIVLFPDAAAAAKRQLGEDIVYLIKRYSKLSCSVGISRGVQGIDRLNDAYQSACAAFYQRFYSGQEGAFLDEGPATPGHDGDGDGGSRPRLKRFEQSLIECIRTLDIPRTHAVLDEMRTELEAMAAPKELVRRFIVEMAVVARREFEHLNLKIEHSADDLLQRLEDASTFRMAIGELGGALAGWIEEVVAGNRHEDAAAAIEKARNYIDNRYHNDLGIDEVSEFVGLSAGHFCTLFKQITGYTFLEYVTHCRMEKAKYILKNTDVKVYQLAPLVGYQDPKYFTQVFKKITGMTPTEYRENA
ncbi:response regulator [Paenibacillus thailandensis]|uniref:Response regulator n=1 Tax=Paenibacillus thailandensis TaxID=393250 RepID=A0ABW5R500_9BACL